MEPTTPTPPQGGPPTRRRTVLGAAGALGATGLLAACSADRKPQTDAGQAAAGGAQAVTNQYPDADAKTLNDSLTWPQTTATEPTEKVSITVSHAWDATFLQRQTQFDKFFMERHPNISVTVENSTWADYRTKYVTAAAGGDLPDLMYMHFSWIQTFIRQGVFHPLTDYLAAQTDFDMTDFTPPSTPPFSKADVLYAIPYDCGPLMLYYNKDLLKKSGIEEPTDDWTMDDLKTAAAKIAEDGGGRVWGLAGGATPGAPDLAPPWLFPFGARYVNDDQTECLITEPAAVQTMEYWVDLHSKGGYPTADEAAAVLPDPFIVGRAGFQLNGTWGTPQLQSTAQFDWAIAKWPAGPVKRSTAAEGSGYAITEDSEQKDAAWIYLNEYISEAGQNFMWASTGRGSPSRSSAWPYYTDSSFAPPGADQILPVLQEFGSADFLYEPQTSKAMDTVAPIWDKVLSGGTSVSDGLAEIKKAIDPILAENAG